MKCLCGLSIVFLLSFPFAVYGAVVINEVSWMGSIRSSTNEWIELKNNDDLIVDISGWTLAAVDGTPDIKLEGKIDARGFFLLERTSDATMPNVKADQIYNGALSNNGEVLFLKDSLGRVVDTVDAKNGWPAGDNKTKYSMQRNGLAWVTAVPTPRAENNAPIILQQKTKVEAASLDESQKNNNIEKGSVKEFHKESLGASVVPVKQDDANLYFWFFLSIVVGLFMGFAFLFIKKKFTISDQLS